ncbi:P-loop containing nucleoside triphosphate hydrolase protein [Lentinula aff. detonsa]|uniref:P-loop containing nucleoside triphosphate hydrolase protein n=1 Tax=Lentinula aff. detonsa TaxID=2804958 RepID=A0AA38KT00_9AGAR|nr:P-loop containing nucleoside triphosphate hydrolase protein [Lentinula aff. detonsa]
MAEAVPRSQVDAMATPEPIEVAQFERQLQDFSDMWLGRDRPDDGLSTALSLFEGDNIEEMRKVFFTDSEDIGVERFAKMTEEDLHVYLGIPSGIPAVFRKFTADDPESIPLGNSGNESFEGAEPVGLSWHQEVWLAAMVGLSVNSGQADVEGIHHTEEGLEKAPMAIREKWGANPGIALLDEVGLGKTMEAIAGIGLLQTLHKVKRDWKPESGLDKLPACIRSAETFGGRAEGIPDAPHLIVVPTNLIDQWASELRRFMNPKAVDLIVVSTNAKKWQSDMRRLESSPQPRYRRVVLVTHKIVQRMFSLEKLEIVANEVQFEPRLRYQLPRHTVFGYSWGSIWVDEVHESRTGKALWRALRGLLELCLIKVLMSATPLVENPEDLLNLARLIRPTTLGVPESENLRNMGRDLRILKSKYRVKTHGAALDFANQDEIHVQTEQNEVTSFAERMVRMIQLILIPRSVRRTNNSFRHDGTRVSAALPGCTILHVLVKVSEAEQHESEQMLDESVQARYFDTEQLGRFFNEGRAKLSFFPGETAALPYTKERLLVDPVTKLKHLLELIKQILVKGSDIVVPAEHHETQDRIIPIEALGNPDVLREYNATSIAGQPVLDEKVLVHTTFAKYHPFMIDALKIVGVNAVSINGAVPQAQRTKTIAEFKKNKQIQVLIMSAVGTQGLNLTCARTLILFESNWSAVLAHQLYGRIHRRGQQRPTFIFQLMASNTVDVLLIANGLAKKELLTNFTQIDRNLANLRLLAGRAAPEEVLALQGGDDVDDALAKSIAEMLTKPKSLTGEALKKRTASKPAKTAKKKEAEPAEDTDGATAPKLSAKAKGKRKAVDPADIEGEVPVAKVPATGSKKRKVKSRPVVEESEMEDDDGEPEGRKSTQARPKPRPKKAKLGELAARVETVELIDRIWHEPLPGQAGPSGTRRESPDSIPSLTTQIPVNVSPLSQQMTEQHLPEQARQMPEQARTSKPSMQVPGEGPALGPSTQVPQQRPAPTLSMEVADNSMPATVPPTTSFTGPETGYTQLPQENKETDSDFDESDYAPFLSPSRAKERDEPMQGIEQASGLQPGEETHLAAFGGDIDMGPALDANDVIMNFDAFTFHDRAVPERFSSPTQNAAFDGALTPLTLTQPGSPLPQDERDEDAAARVRPQHHSRNQPNAEAGPSSSPLVGEKAEYIPRKPVRSSQRALIKRKFGKKPLAGSKRDGK